MAFVLLVCSIVMFLVELAIPHTPDFHFTASAGFAAARGEILAVG